MHGPTGRAVITDPLAWDGGLMPETGLPPSRWATWEFSFPAGHFLKSGFGPECSFYSSIDPLCDFQLIFKLLILKLCSTVHIYLRITMVLL